MCGMIIAVNGSDFSKSSIFYGLAAISHRGFPQTSNFLDFNGSTFAHTRLPVRGLDSKWNQPFILRGEVGVFVGEVFNLPGENDAFQALAQLIEDGPKAATEFDGFFSVAYSRRGQIVVQTDHLGIKPLYYDEAFGVIASELHAIEALRPQKPDELYFSNVLKWGYDPTGRTPYAGVRRIAPGTALVFEKGELIEEYRYWELKPKFGSLDILLRRAVEHRMVSDIPVATLCSGGLDSTIVTLLANDLKPDLKVFHVSNGEDEYFERVVDCLNPAAKVVRVDLSTEHDSDPNFFARAIRAADTPVDLGSVLPQYALAKALARHRVNVVLTGDGADELFGGYRRSKEYDSQYSDVFQELPGYHLPRLDAIMMNQTIELRSPFLAPAVIEAALAIPYYERTEKQALKKYFADLVPREIRDREKKALKTDAVIAGGVQYRQKVVDTWRQQIWPSKT